MKREAGHATVRGDVLILFANRLAQTRDFNVARELGELGWMEQLASMGMERLDQRGRKAAGRPEARAGRNVGQCGDLDLRRAKANHPDGLTDDRMLHLADRIDVFELGVLEKDAWCEWAQDGDVDIL